MAYEIIPIANLVPYAKLAFYVFMVPLVIQSLRFYFYGFAGPIAERFLKTKYKDIPEGKLPKISVHIPVYNDPIVKYCIEDCLNFDYPKDKYEIVVADDSNDETVQILEKFRKFKNVKIIRRDNRNGFKAGALNNAMEHTKGDVIVVFDSDYRPPRNFLRKIVRPFHWDNKIAFVQSRWGYLNPGENSIARAASISYNAFHRCMLPLMVRLKSAIFCGSGGAIRKDVLQEIGGWNEGSVTEDLDMSIRILDKGYKQEYLSDVVATGEVPTKLKAFSRQQQRWAYGTTKALTDYFGRIMSSKKMSFAQKLDFTFILVGFLVYPFILGVMISSGISMAPWFGPNVSQVPIDLAGLSETLHQVAATTFTTEALILFVAASGYFFTCFVGLLMDRRYKELLYLPHLFFIGMYLLFTVTASVFKAFFKIPISFYRTPKKAI